MSLDKFTKLATSLAEQIDNSEVLFTSFLANKLASAAESYPHDSTIVGLASVISKYAGKNGTMTRGQLRQLYNKFYTRNTKFAEIFEQELGGTVKLATPKYASAESQVPVNTDHLGDQFLLNALESVFNGEEAKMYAKDAANKAVKMVVDTLDTWGLGSCKVSIANGNENVIITKASYETPKGATHFYVPVEVLGSRMASPEMFISNQGTQDLNYLNVKSYLTTFAGEKLKISAESILETINKAAAENRQVTDVELALARLKTSRAEKQEFFANQIVSQQVEQAPVKEVQLPRYSETGLFEQKFSTPYGSASTIFGEKVVTTGRDVIARALSSFGYKNSQVSVVDNNENTIFYAVALDSGKIGFTVPVKVAGNKVNPPTVMLCKGAAESFDAATIKKLYVNNISDYKAAAAASPHYGLKGSDLIDSIRSAMEEKNLAKAEDALNVLASSGDAKAYAVGFKIYAAGLGDAPVNNNDITKHPMYNDSDFYTTAASSLPISKQTGLPINKIYIDENGNHRPLYRRGMNESYQGGFFMNYKIFG